MARVYRVGILGGSGMTGGELLRLLAVHPGFEVAWATSREYAGKPVYSVHPHLYSFYQGLKFTGFSEKLFEEADVLFNALPHGVGVGMTADAYDRGLTVVDLSADYRLKDPGLYEQVYGFKHPRPDLLEASVYALPELHRDELAGARLAAAPGCNATATILAAAPLVAGGILGDNRLISDVKAGSSEGGSKPSRGSHHPFREGSLRPYSPWGHRHAFEAEQELSRLAGERVSVTLIPHAVPLVRGAFASVHGWLAEGVTLRDVAAAYARFYGGSKFVRVKPMMKGAAGEPPDVKNIAGSEFAEVGFSVEARTGRVTGFAAVDNLVRGAAGQAIHAANIMLGFPEETGLFYPPLRP